MSKKSKKCKVVAILGGKGGVGKTTFCASLNDYYQEIKASFATVDADTGNSKFGSLAHLVGCKKLDIRSRVGLDSLIDTALGGVEIVLVDFGAGTVDELAKWVGDVGSALQEEGIGFTVVSLITEEFATAEAVWRCAEKIQDQASYVLVENHGKGDVSLTIAKLKEFSEKLTPATILMEPLRSDLAQELDRVGQTALPA